MLFVGELFAYRGDGSMRIADDSGSKSQRLLNHDLTDAARLSDRRTRHEGDRHVLNQRRPRARSK